jgi:hypothetical protein
MRIKSIGYAEKHRHQTVTGIEGGGEISCLFFCILKVHIPASMVGSRFGSHTIPTLSGMVHGSNSHLATTVEEASQHPNLWGFEKQEMVCPLGLPPILID